MCSNSKKKTMIGFQGLAMILIFIKNKAWIRLSIYVSVTKATVRAVRDNWGSGSGVRSSI